jgi:hypothetical protein
MAAASVCFINLSTKKVLTPHHMQKEYQKEMTEFSFTQSMWCLAVFK